MGESAQNLEAYLSKMVDLLRMDGVRLYVRRKVNFQGCNKCELGLEKYVQRIVGRLGDAIVPDESEGEAPLMPITNRYKPIGSTAEVDFKTTRACHATMKSHIDQVVLDNLVWESSAGFRLESSDAVQFYARNDHMGLTIPYEYMGIDHAYEPDFLVRLSNGVTWCWRSRVSKTIRQKRSTRRRTGGWRR
jgi:type III restriction enzyme